MKQAIVIHKCKVENGKLVYFDPWLLNKYLKIYEGKHLNATFRTPHKNRSLDQNSRHWARMTFAADVLGDRTPEELHYDFCALLLIDRTTKPPRIRTTKDLSTKEFSEFEEHIDRVLAEVGIVIPEPGKDFEFDEEL